MLCGSKRFPGVTVTRSGERFSARIANYRPNNQERPGNTGANAGRQKHSGILRPDPGRPRLLTRFRGISWHGHFSWQRAMKFRTQGPGGPARICARIGWSPTRSHEIRFWSLEFRGDVPRNSGPASSVPLSVFPSVFADRYRYYPRFWHCQCPRLVTCPGVGELRWLSLPNLTCSPF